MSFMREEILYDAHHRSLYPPFWYLAPGIYYVPESYRNFLAPTAWWAHAATGTLQSGVNLHTTHTPRLWQLGLWKRPFGSAYDLHLVGQWASELPFKNPFIIATLFVDNTKGMIHDYVAEPREHHNRTNGLASKGHGLWMTKILHVTHKDELGASMFDFKPHDHTDFFPYDPITGPANSRWRLDPHAHRLP